MLVLDLEKLFQSEGSSIPIHHEADFSYLDEPGGFSFRNPVLIEGSVQNEARIVSIRADVTADIDTICDRCASDMTLHMSVPMDHTLVRELNREEDADLYIVLENALLDVEALAAEDLMLDMPSKFLCQEDCKGLCPTCGKNLNDGPCDCAKEVDPRLAALAELLDD